ncbi:MAG: type II toxin-antitoxin system VapC family toxin [Bacillota bacterium]
MEAKDLCKIFIDTGGLIALLDETDTYHREASVFYRSLSRGALVYTSILVISETYTWLRYHINTHTAYRFLQIIEKATRNGHIKCIIPDIELVSKTHVVLREYQDQNLSYTDAMSFVILEVYDIQDVFGFDSHFYSVGRNLWPCVKRR